jgi:hypothetical protein
VPLSIAYGNPGFSSMGSHVLGAFGEPFAIEDLSPGRVLLLLLGEPAFVLPLGEHTLEPGGFLDLGEIVLGPPGTVRFAADPPGDFESKVFDVRLSSLLTPGNAKSALGFDQWPSGTYELFAGDYRVVLTGQGIGVLRAEFAVRSGEETLVIVRR